jgi:1-aminocyclopropane-1-carboxylate synthase
VPFLPADAGLFVVVDLRAFLPAPTPETGEDALSMAREDRLWERLLTFGVNLTPGSTLHCREPGWFRLCFAGMSSERLAAAVQRMVEALKSVRDGL